MRRESMTWPSFDPGEVINQAMTGLVTLLSVIGGGLIAFRYGLRQLREEKAIERRLALLESLGDELNGYCEELNDAYGIYLSAVRSPDQSRFGPHYTQTIEHLRERFARLRGVFERLHVLLDINQFGLFPALMATPDLLASVSEGLGDPEHSTERFGLLEKNVLALLMARRLVRESIRLELGLSRD